MNRRSFLTTLLCLPVAAKQALKVPPPLVSIDIESAAFYKAMRFAKCYGAGPLSLDRIARQYSRVPFYGAQTGRFSCSEPNIREVERA